MGALEAAVEPCRFGEFLAGAAVFELGAQPVAFGAEVLDVVLEGGDEQVDLADAGPGLGAELADLGANVIETGT